MQLKHPCEATLPRKQRTYASYDQLQLRYRALDLMIKRLYPGEAVDSVDDIRILARKKGVDLSDLETEGEDLDPMQSSSSVSVESRRMSMKETSDGMLETIQQLAIPEGELIPAPRGGYHYVGPASSYIFANTVRKLVGKSSLYTLAFDRSAYRRQQRANEFTTTKRTTALEARIQGHPVMAGEDDGTSPMSDGTALHPNEGVLPSPSDRPTPRSVARSTQRGMVDMFPTRAVGEKLVQAFFDRVHPDFPLFHRGTFQVRYESVWASRQSDKADGLEHGWLCVLYMVFVLGAQALERDGFEEAMTIQARYLSVVFREGLQRLILTATHSNVQALALLSLYQHNAGERNTAWMLIGHAARMAVALGMQRDGENANFDYFVRNNRRLVWWSIYLFEQNLSFVLGRPSATSSIPISADMPDESSMDSGNAPPGYLKHAVKLGDLSGKIKRFVAAVSTDYDKAEELERASEMAIHLGNVLSEWARSLPLHLRPEAQFATLKHARAVLLLHVTYQHLQSVICRPYLLCKIDRDLDTVQSPLPTNLGAVSSNIARLAQSSLDAAKICMGMLIDMANLGLLEGETWYDYYYIHHASLVLSLPLLVESSDPQWAPHRALVSTAINIAQKSRLAPTYRILVNVSIQFAKIVGVGPDDDPSRPSSPRGTRPLLHDGVMLGGSGRFPDQNVSMSRSIDTFQTRADPSHQVNADALNHILTSSSGNTTFDNTPFQPWSFLPTNNPSTSSQPLSLEQLLSLPSTSFNGDSTANTLSSSSDMGFSDMLSFGFGLPNTEMSNSVPSFNQGNGLGTTVPNMGTWDQGETSLGLNWDGLGTGDDMWDFFTRGGMSRRGSNSK